MRKLLLQIFSQQGYWVIEADDGVQAIEAFQRYSPDLVVLDAQMPKMSGFDCCRRLRQICQDRLLPILMLTSLHDTASINQAFAAGVTDYITKPFDWTIFPQRVRKLLESSQAIAAELASRVQAQTIELQTRVESLNLLLQIKNEFLSTVSHELRSPLINIRMSTQLLEQLLPKTVEQSNQPDDQQTDLRSQTYLQIIRNECEYGLNLINDFSDLEQLEKSTPQHELILLQAWLEQVVAPFVERAQQRQQALTLQIDADLPPLLSNAASLRRILSELLQNACKYTPAGGTIIIKAEMTLDWFYLRVIPI
jgi:signal transduction histidine kinase